MQRRALSGHRRSPSVRGSNGGSYREAGAQLRRESLVIERDLHGDSLDDFGEISSGVVGWEQGKLRATGGGDLENFAMHDLAGIFVDVNLGGVANFHVGELRLAIVRLNPFC